MDSEVGFSIGFVRKNGTGFVRGPAEASTCIVTWTSEPDSWGAVLNLPRVGWLIQTSSKVRVWKDYDRGAALWVTF